MKKIKIFHPFTILQIPQVEQWLKKKALEGYRLVKLEGWMFTFVECQPKNREYFLYKSPMLEKNDRFWGDFHMSKHQYKLRESEINKTQSDCFEFDTSKIYHKHRHSLVSSRTNHYLKYYRKKLVLNLIFFAILSITAMFENFILPIAFLSLLPVICSFSAVSFLKRKRVTVNCCLKAKHRKVKRSYEIVKIQEQISHFKKPKK